MYRAWEETNPAKRLALAHQALATSPDCADAYVLLAEEEADSLARAADYYRQGMEAGERALGAEYFAENKGDFWGLLETRPYMRAREGLADTLWGLKRREEAREHYRVLLELNPEDNQGVRYTLLNLLLEMERDAEAVALLKQYDDGLAEWLYTWALMEFRQSGTGKAAERRLKAALKQNKHVPAYLSGRKRIPGQLPPYYGYGDEAEAVHYAHRYLAHWRRTPGAVDWLKSRSKF
jgi:tetratricopeptide (TPR) repeat protein